MIEIFQKKKEKKQKILFYGCYLDSFVIQTPISNAELADAMSGRRWRAEKWADSVPVVLLRERGG